MTRHLRHFRDHALRRLLAERDEQGQTLVLVLIVVFVIAILLGAELTQVSGSYGLNASAQQSTRMYYAADGGVLWGLNKVKANSGLCASSFPAQPNIAITNTDVQVTCTQGVGPGTNTFNGYSLISGVGYPQISYAGQSASGNLGNTTCIGIATDAPGKKSSASNSSGNKTCTKYSNGAEASAPVVTVSGGPVFNGTGTNLVTPLQVTDGNFYQFAKSNPGCDSSVTKPTNLQMTGSNTWNCTTNVPNAIMNLDEQLPCTSSVGSVNCSASDPAFCVHLGNCTSMSDSGVQFTNGSCHATVFAPGYYVSAPKISSGGTYYFESGVYYFASAANVWDPSNSSHIKTWIIGGQPSPGDVLAGSPLATSDFNDGSPCWDDTNHKLLVTDLPANQQPAGSWFDGGTGVEFIAGGSTAFTMKSGVMELFTRENGQAWEGAQGVTLREVPQTCAGSTTPLPGPTCVKSTSKWLPSAGPGTGPNPILTAFGNPHAPAVYLHGTIYVPTNDILVQSTELVPTAILMGSIDVNSIELAFSTATSPQIQISGGSTTLALAQITAVANGLVAEQATVLLQSGAWNVVGWRRCDLVTCTP